MNDSVHQMSHVVGKLEGKVEALTDSIENLNRVWGQREQVATEGRRLIHEKLEKMSGDLVLFGAEVKSAVSEVKSMKPHVDTLRNEHQQHLGAARLGKRAWIGLIGVSGLAGGGFGELIRTFWRH